MGTFELYIVDDSVGNKERKRGGTLFLDALLLTQAAIDEGLNDIGYVRYQIVVGQKDVVLEGAMSSVLVLNVFAD